MSTETQNPPNEEFLSCFSEEGGLVAPQPRSKVHTEPLTVWHGVTNVWVLNSKGSILCTRRSASVSGNPSKWQTYVGGHVKADATFSETVRSELDEEIGLKLPLTAFQLVDSGRRRDFMHIFESYAVLYDGELTDLIFSDGEISEAKWLSFKAYQQAKTEYPGQWCNGMHPEHYQKATTKLGIKL